MAFFKYARAALQKPGISFAEWDALRRGALSPAPDFQKRTAKIILQEYDPAKYMLSHATIVASVDVENATAPLGRHFIDGFEVDRKYQDYYITPKTTSFINNNNDGFERKLLLASFKTFIGAQSYVEHVQIPELSKGRIIDAAARDVGDSIYVDILIANELKHAPLIRAIKSGQLGTLSMGCSTAYTLCTKCGNVAFDETQLCNCVRFFKGSEFTNELGHKTKVAELCFPSGTRVISGSGIPVPLDDLQVGDQVLTHKGNRKEIRKIFQRQYEGDLIVLDILGFPHTAFGSTPEHPYFVLSPREKCICGCGESIVTRKCFGHAEYTRSYKRGHYRHQAKDLKPQEFEFKKASEIRVGDMLAMPVPTEVIVPKDVTPERAELLGWFLAEGSFYKRAGNRIGVDFTLNAEDEQDTAKRLAYLLEVCFRPEKNRHHSPKTIETETHYISTRHRIPQKPILAGTDIILQTLKDKGEAVRSDLLITDIKATSVSSILNQYAKLGVVGSRKLKQGERPDLVGRKRSRTRIWYLLDSAIPESNRVSRVLRNNSRLYTKVKLKSKPGVPGLVKLPFICCYPRPEGGEKLIVRYANQEAAEWFYKHCGEYAGAKRLSPDAIFWPVELQKIILQSYVLGDGQVDAVARHSVSSVSDALITQIQILAARADLWTRRQVVFEGKTAQLTSVVNGDCVLVGSDGCRPRHELHFQPTPETTNLFKFDNVAHIDQKNAWRKHDGFMLYRVQGISTKFHSGQVYNISVEGDESYLVEGLAVHNCGHYTDPNSTKFIEASWVGNPAFKGAVLRNILSAEEIQGMENKMHVAFKMPIRRPDPNAMSKAAAYLNLGQGQDFLPDDELSPEPGKEEPEKEKKEENPLQKAVDDLTKAIRDQAIENIRGEITKKEVESIRAVNPNKQNETLIRSALQHPEWQKVAKVIISFTGKERAKRILHGLILHKRGGWPLVKKANFTGKEVLAISRVIDLMTKKSFMAGENRVYRTVLNVGGTGPYEDVETYLTACRQVLGRQLMGSEAAQLLEKGRLFTLGRS